MIEFYITPETDAVLLKDYNSLFDFICDFESSNGFGSEAGTWSFTVHSPDRVAALYHNWKKGDPAIESELQEAYDEQLSLMELCTGDHNNPQYIAITPNIDMDALKKKWCLDYCAFHKLAISETAEEEMDSQIEEQPLREERIRKNDQI